MLIVSALCRSSTTVDQWRSRVQLLFDIYIFSALHWPAAYDRNDKLKKTDIAFTLYRPMHALIRERGQYGNCNFPLTKVSLSLLKDYKQSKHLWSRCKLPLLSSYCRVLVQNVLFSYSGLGRLDCICALNVLDYSFCRLIHLYLFV